MAFEASLRQLVHPIYKALETHAHPLRYLFLEVTQRCNLRCLHCGSDCGASPQLKELSTDEWLSFLGYLGKRFKPSELLLVVTGGEPLCCPDFPRLEAGLKASGLPWGMVSNGWALSRPRLQAAMACGLEALTVSLDGLGASHDWLRGRQGSFDRAVGAIRAAVAERVPFFDVVTCVNPRNLDELPELSKRLRAEGVPALRLFTIFPKGRAKQNAALKLDDAQLRRLFDWIRDERARTAGSGFSVQYSCEGYLPPKLDEAVRDAPYFCRAGVNIASVLCDGSISACPNISRGLVQGNIRDDDFLRVWEKRFAPFRAREWMRTGDCAGCAEWGRCQGNSLHLWDDERKQTVLCHHRVLSAPAASAQTRGVDPASAATSSCGVTDVRTPRGPA